VQISFWKKKWEKIKINPFDTFGINSVALSIKTSEPDTKGS